MTSATPSKPKVHVIDDDDAVRDSLAFLLRSADIDVATHESAAAFLRGGVPSGIGCIVTDVRMPEVGGIVHTHSPYATAWAALGRDIPCILTAMADEFGGVIPCGEFALIGGEEIGREVVRVLREGPNPHSPAVIMQNHGVFTVGPTPLAAVKAAVMCEDVARTVYLAVQLGEPVRITPEDIAKLHDRYTNVYGQ